MVPVKLFNISMGLSRETVCRQKNNRFFHSTPKTQLLLIIHALLKPDCLKASQVVPNKIVLLFTFTKTHVCLWLSLKRLISRFSCHVLWTHIWLTSFGAWGGTTLILERQGTCIGISNVLLRYRASNSFLAQAKVSWRYLSNLLLSFRFS